MNKLHYLIIFFVALLGMVACSEDSDTGDQYANWQAKNDAYFEEYYDSAAKGLNGWQRIKGISKDQKSEGAHTDYILVKVLKNGTSGTECPYGNDTVRVHYRGWMMPSESYTDSVNRKTGLQFDTSWYGPYDESTMTPYKASVGSFVTGFGTALQHMHIGDRWLVIIPYQLGYNASTSGSIPAYSVLKFDMTLHSFIRAGHAMPTFQ